MAVWPGQRGRLVDPARAAPRAVRDDSSTAPPTSSVPSPRRWPRRSSASSTLTASSRRSTSRRSSNASTSTPCSTAIDLDVLLGPHGCQALVDRLDVDQIVAKLDMNAPARARRRRRARRAHARSARSSPARARVSRARCSTPRAARASDSMSFVHRWMGRLLRRRPVGSRPGGPPLLVGLKASAT